MKSGIAVRKSVIAWAAIISAVVQQALGGLILSLAHKLPGDESVINFFLSIASYLVTYFISMVILQLLTNVKWIRITILKEKIVEGDWVEVIYYDEERTRPFCYGWVKTYFDHNGELVYEGTDYDLINLKKTGDFFSTSSALKYNSKGNTATLNYTYDFYFGAQQSSGFGRIEFIVGKSGSDRHSGLFSVADGYRFFDAKLVKCKKHQKALKNHETFDATFLELVKSVEVIKNDQPDEMQVIYSQRPDLFDTFSQHEDHCNNISTFFQDNFDFCGKTVLDMGVGTGRFTALFVDSAAKVICTDLSRKMIQYTKEKFSHLRKPMEFHICDHGMVPALVKDKVDFIIAGYTLGAYFNNKDLSQEECVLIYKQLIKSCRAVLKKGGKIIIVENISLGGKRLSFDANLDEYINMLVEDGFEKNEICTDFKFETSSDANYYLGSFWGPEAQKMIPAEAPFIVPEISGIFVKEY